MRLGELLSVEANRSIEDYESNRGVQRRKRQQLYLNPTERTEILLTSGCTQYEIDDAIVTTRLAKEERAESIRLARCEQSNRDPFRKLMCRVRRRMSTMKRHMVLFSHRCRSN